MELYCSVTGNIWLQDWFYILIKADETLAEFERFHLRQKLSISVLGMNNH